MDRRRGRGRVDSGHRYIPRWLSPGRESREATLTRVAGWGLLAAVGVLGAVVMACTSEADEDLSPVVVERLRSESGVAASGGSGDERLWPPSHVKLTREQAIQMARERCTGSGPEVTPVDDPHDPVARLMPYGEFEDRIGGTSPLEDPEHYVWVVQFEGKSTSAGIAAVPGREPHVFRFAGCVLDAESGASRAGFRRPSEPLLLPTAISPRIPAEASDPNLGMASEAMGAVVFTREEARKLVLGRYSLPGFYVDRLEIELVRYTGTCHGQLGPMPTATAAAGQTATAVDVPDAASPRVQCGVEWGSRDSKSRLSWLVIIPVELNLNACGPAGPAGSSRHGTCWTQQVFALIDAESGEQFGDGGNGRGGPIVTNEEHQALQRLAWAEGWWELWHRVKDHAGQPLPEGYAASLDRPDAPTPTPRPIPTVPPDATPTPTPTPPPAPPTADAPR